MPGKRPLDLLRQRRKLPISGVQSELIRLARQHKCFVLVAETGSGKTTQVPQFLVDSGLAQGGCIAVTQPRRVAAVSVAQRVAEERRCDVGGEVGYAIRFDDNSSASTRIKYVTDGMLLREALLSPALSKYKVVIIDEAHERTVQTDVLLGLLRMIMRGQRDDLRLIVMSATLDVMKFSSFLDNCCIAYVQGRQHRVEMFYTARPEESYVDAAVATVLQVHADEAAGDILVFLTGQEEIEAVQRLLLDRGPENARGEGSSGPGSHALHVTALYAALPPERQAKVFGPAPEGTRKVILATNIAETSITVPGVRYVVDTGFVKTRQYNPTKGSDSLQVVPVSRAQASQRSGRAGREAPGKAFRLFTEATFQALAPASAPEVLRTNLASVVLQLKALGVHDVLGFIFLDRPPLPALARALELLLAIGALDAEGHLTPSIGRGLVRLPVEPMQGAVLLAAAKSGCLPDALAVVAMWSTDPVVASTRRDSKAAAAARRRLTSATGDHATARNIYRAYVAVPVAEQRRWCRDLGLSHRSLRKAVHIHAQLGRLMAADKAPGAPVGSSEASLEAEGRPGAGGEGPGREEALGRALVAGLFCHAAMLQPDGGLSRLAPAIEVSAQA